MLFPLAADPIWIFAHILKGNSKTAQGVPTFQNPNLRSRSCPRYYVSNPIRRNRVFSGLVNATVLLSRCRKSDRPMSCRHSVRYCHQFRAGPCRISWCVSILFPCASRTRRVGIGKTCTCLQAISAWCMPPSPGPSMV